MNLRRPTKIVYVLYHNVKNNDGVVKKIRNQIFFWNKQGIKVHVLCLVSERGNSVLECEQFETSANPLLRTFKSEKHFLKRLAELEPDLIYTRFELLSFCLLRILIQFKTVVEMNTDDLGENRSIFRENWSLKAFSRVWLNLLGRRLILKRASALIAVTNEIKRKIENRKYVYKITVIPNGIDFSGTKKLKRSRSFK